MDYGGPTRRLPVNRAAFLETGYSNGRFAFFPLLLLLENGSGSLDRGNVARRISHRFVPLISEMNVNKHRC